MALPNPAMSFSPFAILTAEELNDIVENINALATGSGLNDSAITTPKIGAGQVTSDKIDFTTSANGGQLFVQKVDVFSGQSGTLYAAGSIYYLDIATAGNWPVAFSSLLGVIAVCDNQQFWVTVNGGTTSGYGVVRLYKFSNASQPTKVTVIGIGLK